ncbi:uncharacterized protein BJ212DRAFT_1300275 [Suillus subaureus]|uniref:Uncharacterized protein n=1 Tax=Suillus subaureus TaxID=48587 RepID=A0A9P7JCS8_9AGAM|nr:uncharacterized protein BJ212DRAFT_1300275 [Suillus subaureus]KAG1815083.1 hypothetical protein BJ212DRAFT_1300275 [Suillus subaureus]
MAQWAIRNGVHQLAGLPFMGPRKKHGETCESSNAYIPLRRKAIITIRTELQWDPDGTRQGLAIAKFLTRAKSDASGGFKLGDSWKQHVPETRAKAQNQLNQVPQIANHELHLSLFGLESQVRDSMDLQFQQNNLKAEDDTYYAQDHPNVKATKIWLNEAKCGD